MVFIIMRLLVSESAAAVDDDVSDEKRGLQSEAAVECHEQNSCTTADDTAQPPRKRTAAVFDV